MNFQYQGPRFPRGRRGYPRGNFGGRGRGGQNLRGHWHNGPNNQYRPRFIPPPRNNWSGPPNFHGGPHYNNFSPGIPPHPPLLLQHPMTFPERSFRSPPPLPPARTSPLPGSEEYIQRNIKETSERIKKQLNLAENEVNEDDVDGVEEEEEETPKVEITFNSTFKPDAIFSETPLEAKVVAAPKIRRDSKGEVDVEDIRNKIIAHITNLSAGKKMNLINIGSESYDEAIHQIQKNERLAIIRALRDTCSDQPTEASSILSSIIPDIDIKIEDLPADKREELSSSLKIYSDEMFGAYESTVDPDLMFQQAQEMLSGLPDDIDSVLEGVNVNVPQDDATLCNMELSPLHTDLLTKIPMADIENSLDKLIEPLEDPAAETMKIRELLNEPVISSDMSFKKKPQGASSPLGKQRALEESYKQFEAEIYSSLVTYTQPQTSPNNSERFLNDSGRFKNSDSRAPQEDLLPLDFNFSSSYLNFKSGTKTPEHVVVAQKEKGAPSRDQIVKIKSEPITEPIVEPQKIKTELQETIYNHHKLSLDERIAFELQKDTPALEKEKRRRKTQHQTSVESVTRCETPPKKSQHDFLQPKVTETSDAQRKKIWRSPGEKKFMSEQTVKVSMYDHSDTELDFSGSDPEDDLKRLVGDSTQVGQETTSSEVNKKQSQSEVSNSKIADKKELIDIIAHSKKTAEVQKKVDKKQHKKHQESNSATEPKKTENMEHNIKIDLNKQETSNKRQINNQDSHAATILDTDAVKTMKSEPSDVKNTEEHKKEIKIDKTDSVETEATKHNTKKSERKKRSCIQVTKGINETNAVDSKLFLQKEANAELNTIGKRIQKTSDVEKSESPQPTEYLKANRANPENEIKPDKEIITKQTTEQSKPQIDFINKTEELTTKQKKEESQKDLEHADSQIKTGQKTESSAEETSTDSLVKIKEIVTKIKTRRKKECVSVGLAQNKTLEDFGEFKSELETSEEIQKSQTKDHEKNLRRRSSSRFKKAPKPDIESATTNTIEVKSEDLEADDATKRKKLPGRRKSKESTQNESTEIQATADTVASNNNNNDDNAVEQMIESASQEIVSNDLPEETNDIQQNIKLEVSNNEVKQTKMIGRRKSKEGHRKNLCATEVHPSSENVDISEIAQSEKETNHEIEETAHLTRTRSKRALKQEVVDVNITETRKEKQRSKSKKSKRASKRRKLKLENSNDTQQNQEIHVKMEFPSEDNPKTESIDPIAGLLRVKSLAQLLPPDELPSSTEPSTVVEIKNDDVLVENVVQKRKRKLSESDQATPMKLTKLTTKDACSQTDEPASKTFNNASSQATSTSECHSCNFYKEDLEEKRKWVDELRKIDETIQSLLLAKAELYDKLLLNKHRAPVRQVARKRIAIAAKPTNHQIFVHPPGKTRKNHQASPNNLTGAICRRKVKLDSKYYQPCYVHLYRYTEEHFERMMRDVEYLRYVENRRYQPPQQNSVNDGRVSNLKIVSVTSLAKEQESMESVEVVKVDEEQLNAIISEYMKDVVLVLMVVGTELLAATDTGKIHCFDLKTGVLAHVIQSSNMAITALCVIANKEEGNTLCVGSLDATLKLYSCTEKKLKKYVQLEDKVQCMETMWGFIFMGSDKGHLTRYNVEKNKREFHLKISESNVLVIKATMEGARRVLLVALKQSPVCVRDAMSGLLMRNMEAPFSPSVYTLLLEKNLVYCGTSKHDILVHNFHDGQLVCQHHPQPSSTGIVVLHLLGNLLFAGCYNGNIYIFNTATNEYLGFMKGPGGLLLSMTIVNDSMVVLGTKLKLATVLKIPEEYLKHK